MLLPGQSTHPPSIHPTRRLARLKLQAWEEAEEDASAAIGVEPAHVKALLLYYTTTILIY